MPRVRIKKNTYMVSDFGKWLKGEIRSQGLTQENLAYYIGITQAALSVKIKTGAFKLSELITIFQKLNVPENKVVELMKGKT